MSKTTTICCAVWSVCARALTIVLHRSAHSFVNTHTHTIQNTLNCIICACKINCCYTWVGFVLLWLLLVYRAVYCVYFVMVFFRSLPLCISFTWAFILFADRMAHQVALLKSFYNDAVSGGISGWIAVCVLAPFTECARQMSTNVAVVANLNET